jgi:hypothetical protein
VHPDPSPQSRFRCAGHLRLSLARVVEPLKAPDYFARAFVEMGAPTWPNGFDADPINLYMQLREAGALTRVAAK